MCEKHCSRSVLLPSQLSSDSTYLERTGLLTIINSQNATQVTLGFACCRSSDSHSRIRFFISSVMHGRQHKSSSVGLAFL